MKLLPWLQLVRLPNLPSAITNVFSGAIFAAMAEGHSLGAHGSVELSSVAAAAGASLCIYAAGLVFNDVADREEDRKNRPERPIPSGAISAGAAVALGLFLLLLGGILFTETAPAARKCLAGVAALALLYDFFLKKSSAWGPLALGLCRSGNWLAGALASGYTVFLSQTSWKTPHFIIGSAIFLYIFSVASLARMEDSQFQKEQARLELGLALLALLGLGAFFAYEGMWISFAGLGLFSGYLFFHFRQFLRQADQKTTRMMVGNLLMGIYVVDAAIAYSGVGVWALLFLLPLAFGSWIRRTISPT